MVGAVAALALAALALAGCSKKLHLPVVVDQRPVVHLTLAPASPTVPYTYVYEIRWTGFDPDGAVQYFEYVVDPPTSAGADTPWVKTTDNRQTFVFTSSDPDSLGTKLEPGGFHVFVIRAVDDAGLYSAPVVRAFFSYTVAPAVSIVQPRPSSLLLATVPPTVTIYWSGYDPDGRTTQKPVRYKYHLFNRGDPTFPLDVAVVHPDSLRKHFAPDFAGWDSTTTDTTVHFDHLTPGAEYLFVVVGWDEAGAYSPVFDLNTNMLHFTAGLAGLTGPTLTLFSPYFSYVYPSPGFDPDPTHGVPVSVPWNQALNVQWSARPAPGTVVQAFRWAMDIASLDDETPRSSQTDYVHWSAWNGLETSALVGPFLDAASGGPQQHEFYVEARDDNGSVSLGHLTLQVIFPRFRKDLLFVNDTRFAYDNRADRNGLRIPAGLWPCESELDSFFFARGGVPWQYYPAGTLSRPGIFAGYSFDTLNTHNIREGIVPVQLLSQYRHVVWSVDPAGANTRIPTDPLQPMPGMRYMSNVGQVNTLTFYAALGGSVWLQGGGGAYNSLINFNTKANDVGTTIFADGAGELILGRLMYDAFGWRSEITSGFSAYTLARSPAAVGGWPGAPDYSQLPASLLPRSTATDPLPPLRGAATFYPYSGTPVEYLSAPNAVLGSAGGEAVSLLDTLYQTNTGIAPPGMPAMTYDHASGSSAVFTGFAIWYLQRAQAIQLGDFVLQQVWGLPRAPVQR